MPSNHHTIIVETCPDCGGDGGGESMPDMINGAPASQWIVCRACAGHGEVETEYECRTLDDLEDELLEIANAEARG